MIDLTTTFAGLSLKNPLIASASPLTGSIDTIRALEEHGVAAVILHSLFEEEITHDIRAIDHYLHLHNDSHAEAMTYLPTDVDFDNLHADHYLEEIRRAKESVEIPLIGSLNGATPGGWVRYAKRLCEAGVDAIELNITHIPTSLDLPGSEVEKLYTDTVALLRDAVEVPINVKMNSYFSNPAYMAKRLVESGANGLTLFDNPVRIDVDLELLSPLQHANLTTSANLSETLRWCAILYGRLEGTLCANTGVHTGEDVLKALMSGADAAACTTAFLRHGPEYALTILNDMQAWMEKHEYESVRQMVGSISLRHCDNPETYERSSYMYALQHYR